MHRCVPVASLVLAAFVGSSSAEFIVPETAFEGWDRGVTANSLYAEWDVFLSPAGPNPPDVDDFVGGVLPPEAPAFDVFDANWPKSQTFITSGGNIYSFGGINQPQINFGGFGLGEDYATTIIFQIRTLGNELDLSSVLLNGSIAPVAIIELDRQPLGGFGGAQVDMLFRFEVDGNDTSYVINCSAAATSTSLDRVAIDTFAVQVPACSGDTNGDGSTDAADLSVVIGAFGTAVAPGTSGDLNGDGVVDAADLSILIGDFSCGSAG